MTTPAPSIPATSPTPPPDQSRPSTSTPASSSAAAEKEKPALAVSDKVQKTVEKVSQTFSPWALWDQFVDLSIEYNIMTFLIGTVMGLAVTNFVKSLNQDVITPLLLAAFGKRWQDYYWTIGKARIDVGSFVNAIVQMGLIVFIILLLLSTIFQHDVHAKRESRLNKQLTEEEQRVRHQEMMDTLKAIQRNTQRL